MPPSHPSPNDKDEIAKLWQDIFHDSDEYTDLFFNRVYKPENTLVIKHNECIVSALQMIPYPVKLNDTIIQAAYLCGLYTHPLERGKGLMKTLMRYAMAEMKRRGYGLAIVIPAEPSLFIYYRNLGFTSPINHAIVFQSYGIYNNVWNRNAPFTFEPCSNEHFPYFDRKQREREKTILHDEYDFETILRELKSDGGEAFAAIDNNRPAGMAFAIKSSQNTVLFKEIFADNEKIHEALLRHACRLFDANNVKIILPATPEKETTPYGLACIIDNQCDSLNNIYMSLMLD